MHSCDHSESNPKVLALTERSPFELIAIPMKDCSTRIAARRTYTRGE